MLERFDPKQYRKNKAEELNILRTLDLNKAEELLKQIQESPDYKMANKYKKGIETNSSKYNLNEELKKLGEDIVLVREISVPQELSEKLEKGLNIEDQFKYFDYFYEISDGRYPSFYTFSHVIGGGDDAALGQSFVKRESGKNVMGLRDQDLEKILEKKTKVENGFCCATGFNAYFGVYDESLGRGGVVDNRNKPLIIFGSQNKNFLNFVEKKYEPITGKLSKDKMLGISALNYLKKTAVETTLEGSYSKSGPNAKYFEKITDMNKIAKNDIMYDYGDTYKQFPNKLTPFLQADLPVAFGLPVNADIGDGFYVSTNIKRFYEQINEKVNLDLNTDRKDGLNFTDAEMIIDLKGLFDGKPKVIKFIQE